MSPYETFASNLADNLADIVHDIVHAKVGDCPDSVFNEILEIAVEYAADEFDAAPDEFGEMTDMTPYRYCAELAVSTYAEKVESDVADRGDYLMELARDC